MTRYQVRITNSVWRVGIILISIIGKIVLIKKATEVAIPPNGDIFLLLNLFSPLSFSLLNCFVKCKKVLLSNPDKVIAKSSAPIIRS